MWLDTMAPKLISFNFSTVINMIPPNLRPVPIPHFITDTYIRYLLSISDTENRYLIYSQYFIIVANIHYFQFPTQYNIMLSNNVTILVIYDCSQIKIKDIHLKKVVQNGSTKKNP